ncbi:MAG: class I mannose-6-phosphate isomerase [Muribaculum sp.]|nr:class I mannose-6-phosphate isomerase [Muribaculum sp.]
MLVLDTIVHETIWGGNKLAEKIGKQGVKMGHLYSCYAREDMSNVILNGRYAGKTLNEVFNIIKESIGLGRYNYFPLTLALTEADSDLSIQVHPDDTSASALESIPRGKRESWYFIDEPKSGNIVNGCKLTDIDAIKSFVSDSQYDKIINYLPVKQGDYVFVEPGTLHAISSGSLVYEIEEGADATYRFYDYDRTDDKGNKRELHTEKALRCLNPELISKIDKYEEDKFIIEKTYATMKISEKKTYVNKNDGIECFTLVEGAAVCDGITVCNGMTVILMPGEKIVNADIQLAFIARINKGA